MARNTDLFFLSITKVTDHGYVITVKPALPPMGHSMVVFIESWYVYLLM